MKKKILLFAASLLLSVAPAFADEFFVEWKNNFGGSGHDWYTSAKAAFGGATAVGHSYSESFGNGDWTDFEGKGGKDAIIVRYEYYAKYGYVKWKNNFGGSGEDHFWSVTAVADGYVAVGQSDFSSFGNGDWTGVTGKGGNDAIIVKFDLEGDVVWKKHFGGSGEDLYYAVTAVSDGVIAVGRSAFSSFGNGDWTGITGKGGEDAIIVKYDFDGNIVWKKNFGGSGYDEYTWITEVSDGVIATGCSGHASFGNGDWTGVMGKGGTDAIIVKYDHDGNVVWKKNFGGSDEDVFSSVTAISDGCIAVGHSCANSFGNGDWTGVEGKGNRDAIIVKYDHDGNIVWRKNFGGSSDDMFVSVVAASDGIVAVGNSGGNSFNNGDWTGIMGKGGNDATMVKFDHDGNVLWKGNFGGIFHDYFMWASETENGFVMMGYSQEESFGNGDWTGVEGKGGDDAAIVKLCPFITSFIPVTDIINVPPTAKVYVPLTLSGKVVPGNATYQVFSWELKDAGVTGATLTNGNLLNTTNIGTVVVTAIIENGIEVGENFTKDFVIVVNPEDFIPVIYIHFGPSMATAGIPLTLTGTVFPETATNKTITWSVKDAGATGATITGGNILNTTATGITIVTATIKNGLGLNVDYVQDFTIAVNPVGFVPVTDIINVITFTIVGTPLTLAGTVIPTNATYKTILWSLKDAGVTGATLTGGNILNATNTGKVIVTATVKDGLGLNINFTKDFTIAINPEGYISVIDIIDVPTMATAKIPLPLTGTVIPENANNKTITWRVHDKGTTGATISSGILNTTATGIAIIRATITNGIGAGVPFIKDFDIVVKDDVGIDLLQVTSYELQVYPNPTRGEVRISISDYPICDIRLFDIIGHQISIVGQSEIGQSKIAINLAHLPAGIYLIRIQTENGVVVRKVVKN